MKNLLISFFISLSAQVLLAVPSDTVKTPDLTYHSDFEKKTFATYLTDKQFDTLAFLLAVDSTISSTGTRQAQNELQAFYKTIDTEGDKKKKNLKKFVDFLFTNIHARFLKKYDSNVSFSHIFQDGIYNCATATALYAVIFEHYGIKYYIKEQPNHVYLIVDPAGLSIMIETTDPKGGYFAPSDKFKKNYVNQLLEGKVVTQLEVATEGVQSVFEKHYYENTNEHLSIPQLVALLYYNKAVDLNENEEYKAAFFELEKAYQLYPCDRIKFVLLYTVYSEVEKKQKNQNQAYDIESVRFFTKMFPYINFAKTKKAVVSGFEELSNEVLIKKNKADFYDQVFSIYDSSIPDSATLSEIRFVYYDKKAQEAFLKSKYKLSLDYTEKGLAINSNDLRIRSNFSTCILRSMGNSQDFEKILGELDVFGGKYSFLNEDEKFLRALVYSLMGVCASKCYKDEYSASLKYFVRFEKLMAEHPMDIDGDLVGGGYGEASSYCIRKLMDYDKARDWLNRGFKYEPDSEILKRKLKTLDENPMPSKKNVSTEELKVIDVKDLKLAKPPKPKQSKN